MKNLTSPIINPAMLTEIQRDVLRERYEWYNDPEDYSDQCVRYELRYIFGENFFKKGE